MQRWVIPDIHGSLATLQTLIKCVIVPEEGDSFFFLGDYVDRGPDSKGVIDYIMELQKQYKVRYLIGNHEEFCITAWEADQGKHGWFRTKTSAQRNWEQYGGKATLSSFNVKWPSEIPTQYIEWMKKGEYYIELEDYFLVHAGMNFAIQNPLDDKFAMLWARDFKVDSEKINHKKLIHGHVPLDLSFIDMTIKEGNGGFIALDNGIYEKNNQGMGNLLAFNIDTKELVVQSNMDN